MATNEPTAERHLGIPSESNGLPARYSFMWLDYLDKYEQAKPHNISSEDVDRVFATGKTNDELKLNLILGAIKKSQEIPPEELSEMAWKNLGVRTDPALYTTAVKDASSDLLSEDFKSSIYVDTKGRLLATGKTHAAIASIYGIPEDLWDGIYWQLASEDFQRRTGAIQGAVYDVNRMFLVPSDQPITDEQLNTLDKLFSGLEYVGIEAEGFPPKEFEESPSIIEIKSYIEATNIRPQTAKINSTEIIDRAPGKPLHSVEHEQGFLTQSAWLSAYASAKKAGLSTLDATNAADRTVRKLKKLGYTTAHD